jgi:hypothetical protein
MGQKFSKAGSWDCTMPPDASNLLPPSQDKKLIWIETDSLFQNAAKISSHPYSSIKLTNMELNPAGVPCKFDPVWENSNLATVGGEFHMKTVYFDACWISKIVPEIKSLSSSYNTRVPEFRWAKSVWCTRNTSSEPFSIIISGAIYYVIVEFSEERNEVVQPIATTLSGFLWVRGATRRVQWKGRPPAH